MLSSPNAMRRGTLVASLLSRITVQAVSIFPPLPTVTPTIFDPSAPSTNECPGYHASNVTETDHGLSADLTLAGSPCDVFGSDIVDLRLEVTYQSNERLNVRIEPKHISPSNHSRFMLGTEFVQLPQWDGQTTQESSDLVFLWHNTPSFQFSIRRSRDGEQLFSTADHPLVFEDQFLELTTSMVPDYNVYGLAENIRNFRLGTNYTQTIFNADSADALDENAYGSHPFYQETRYWKGKPSTAHGVYARNAHAQEWLMRERTLTFRAIGGIIDLYFLGGESDDSRSKGDPSSSALEVIRQYQQGCVGLPAMQQYWTLGFHQSHWGWKSIAKLHQIIENYEAAGIPVESIWSDIDIYDRARIFTNNEVGYPSDGMHNFVEHLHNRDQHYVCIQDSNVYFPNPANPADVESYPAFRRGAEVNAFIRDANTGYFFIGENWPGYSVWADWFNPAAHDWWVDEMVTFYGRVPFDGVWVDLNEPQSFCTYSCGNVQVDVPFSMLPGGVMNVSLSDPRHLNFPPYRINNAKPTKQIIESTIALDAFHNDEHHTREYDTHNLFSIGVLAATFAGIEAAIPAKRPFILTRSTFIGAGRYAAHWGGDNKAQWGAMYLSISQSFLFQMVGIPMFGVDTCGFAQNTTEELCARWMQLSAFFPFYRNHYADGKRPQEAYIWPNVAEASRRAIGIRYSLLPYLYTLLFNAHTRGDTMMRALGWEFPDDESLREVDNQFLLGPSLLVTPVLMPNTTTVKGTFPGIRQGTRWYDWYTLQEVKGVEPGENVTMSAPLEHVNLHIRGGSIIPLQKPGSTTAATRRTPWSLVVALDDDGHAEGKLYLDDGESVVQEATKLVQFDFTSSRLIIRALGNYISIPPLTSITITGLAEEPSTVTAVVDKDLYSDLDWDFGGDILRISHLQAATRGGAWERNISIDLAQPLMMDGTEQDVLQDL